MKKKERRGLDVVMQIFPWGILFLLLFLSFGLFCVVLEFPLLGGICIAIFIILGMLYGWVYYRVKKLLSEYYTKTILNVAVANDTEDAFLESVPDEEPIQSVDVKFDMSEIGSKNCFLAIKIPSSFIDKFKNYTSCLNSPSILGKKIYEWGDRDNGMCIQNVLCFSKAEIKSTIEEVTDELYAAIEWLPNEKGDRSRCTQKWVMFAWK